MTDRSRKALIHFLERQAKRGEVPMNTALSRMASVRKVLAILSDQEASDVTGLDVEAVMRRFIDRSAHQYSLASQVSYKSRLRSALEDFNAAHLRAAHEEMAEAARPVGDDANPAPAAPQCQSVQIPLSRGWTVVVDRLPIDLTETEAQRIGKVVLAYAMTA
jgi:hypothetical protein